MTEQARQARNAYQRKWRKQNPEKFQAQIERYWQSRKDAGRTADQSDHRSRKRKEV